MEKDGGDELFECWWENLDPLKELPPSTWPLQDPGTQQNAPSNNAGKLHQRHLSDAETALNPLVPPSVQHFAISESDLNPLDDVLESPHLDISPIQVLGDSSVLSVPPAEPAFVPVANPRAVPAFPITETIPEDPFLAGQPESFKQVLKTTGDVSVAPMTPLQPPGTPLHRSSAPTSLPPPSVTTPTSVPNTKRKKDTPRRRISGPQAELLESHFHLDPRPDKETREDLSRRTGVEFKSVTIWFQNRRAKDRNRMLQQSSHESLVNLYSSRDGAASSVSSRQHESSPPRAASIAAAKAASVAAGATIRNPLPDWDSISSPMAAFTPQGTPVSRVASRASWSPPRDWAGSPGIPWPKTIPQVLPSPTNPYISRPQVFGRSRSTYSLPVVPRDQYEGTPKRRRSEFGFSAGVTTAFSPSFSPSPPATPRSRFTTTPSIPSSPAPAMATAAAEHLRTRHRSFTQPVGRVRPRLELAEENHSATLVMHPANETGSEAGGAPSWRNLSPSQTSPSPSGSPIKKQ